MQRKIAGSGQDPPGLPWAGPGLGHGQDHQSSFGRQSLHWQFGVAQPADVVLAVAGTAAI
jgi:hypothetical protein